MSGDSLNRKVTDITPYENKSGKATQVEEMFDHISSAYDFMNTAMTFGLHRYWLRVALKRLARALDKSQGLNILDVATGTGDVAFRLYDTFPGSVITGIDLSTGMLSVAEKKRAKRYGDDVAIHFTTGDCLKMPFDSDSYDAVTVAYGVRNFSDLKRGYQEMHRVLRKGGKLCVIELSEPSHQPLLGMYRLYSHHIIPAIGRMVSGDSRAYTYLPESIAACPSRTAMTDIILSAGFSSATFKSLTFGVVTVYIAEK
jgi:demethylmenaquinone methyltransferase/2-methoxy-6-polyprenyl-1,4-benzoquinol methylase